MYSTFYIPHEAIHVRRFDFARTAKAAAGFLCLLLFGYFSMGVFRDIRLVNEAFPALPSGFATDMDASIFFSPMQLSLDQFENAFLRWIKYPLLTLPNAPLPTGNPIEDQVFKAQQRQGLLRPGGAAPLAQLMLLNKESLNSVGRAIYLSQKSPKAAESFELGTGDSMAHPGFARESAVNQVRQIFAAVYGQSVMQEAVRGYR